MQVIEDGDQLQYRELALKLLENADAVSLLAASLKMLTKEPDLTPVKITPEEPWVAKKSKYSEKRSKPAYRQKPVSSKSRESRGGYKKKPKAY
jgi:ATP-dependent RNA helicase DeaD